MRLPQDRILHIDTELAGYEVRVVAEWQGELVRCKDCEYYDKGENEVASWSQCTRAFGTFFNAQDNDFCSWAKMKGGNE